MATNGQFQRPPTGRNYWPLTAYIRNATAHADAGKLGACPTFCEGTLWLRKADGSWSVQQPHGLTALRAALAIYNTVAEGIHSILSLSSVLSLTSPDMVDYPARG